MKLFLHCPACFEQFGPFQVPAGEQNKLANLAVATAYEVQVRNDFTYHVDCAIHNIQTSILATPRFEILFQIGLNAILDGYFRDAVTSLYSSLEHFIEYYLNVIAAKNCPKDDGFQAAWSIVKKQSERQLGAFVIVYTYENGSPPPTPERIKVDNKKSLVSFRNEVVHQGRIPTRDEALSFGDGILSIISPVLADLRNKHPENVSMVDDLCFRSARDKLPKSEGPIGKASFHPAFGPAYSTKTLGEKMNEKLELLVMIRDGIPRMREALDQLSASQDHTSVDLHVKK